MKKRHIETILLIILILFSSTSVQAAIQKQETKIKDTINIFQTNNREKQNQDFVPGEFIVRFKSEIKLKNLINTSEGKKTGISSIDKLNTEHKTHFIKRIFPQFKKHQNNLENIYKIKVPYKSNIQKIVENYQKNPLVEYAQPNYFITLQSLPNDPYLGLQWAFNNVGQGYPSDRRYGSPPGTPDADIDLFEAWNNQKDNEEIVIAVLDTGVDYNHPDLKENIWVNSAEDINNNGKFDNWPSWFKKDGITGDIDNVDNDNNGYIDDIIGWDFCKQFKYLDYLNNGTKEDNDPMDKYGHGTHCAGIIGATSNNSIGISGVCLNSKIMSLKIGNSKKYEKLKRYDVKLDIIAGCKAIVYAADNGAQVISMSWNTLFFSEFFKNAIDYAYEKDVVLVAAAGNFNNDKSTTSSAPDCYPNVISVAATDSSDRKAEFSDYGFLVDIAAPGVDILSLRAKNENPYFDERNIVDDKYLISSGTSMACPMVSGLAAFILSQDPSLNPSEVETIIRSSTDKINSELYIGTGRINAKKALQMIEHVVADLNHSKLLRDVKKEIIFEGTAIGKNFEYYTVEYGRGIYPDSFTEIENQTKKINNKILAKFNTTKVKDGMYTIRLKVVCNKKEYYDNTAVLINNHQETIIVDKTGKGNYTTIFDAIKNAGEKDTIYVKNGTYNKPLHINRKINLIGENKNNTKIMTEDNAITIEKYKNIKISGFTISSKKGIGIHLKRGSNLIKNNIIKDSHIALACELLVYSNQIKNNKFIENNKAIYGTFKNTIIENNVISKSNVSIELINTENSIIQNNTIKENKKGILITKRSKNNTIIKNYFIDNQISALIKNSLRNYWNNNYWDKRRVFPKIIFGFIEIRNIPLFPLINIDWNPIE